MCPLRTWARQQHSDLAIGKMTPVGTAFATWTNALLRGAPHARGRGSRCAAGYLLVDTASYRYGACKGAPFAGRAERMEVDVTTDTAQDQP